MKKTIILVLTTVFAVQMHAQINEPGRFYITPKLGYNMANITLLDDFGADPRHALHAGIAAEYAFSERLSLEPGLFYSMQGSAFKGNTENRGLSLNSDYLTVPLLIKVYVAEGLHLFAGPQFGYLVSSRFKAKTGSKLIDGILNLVSNNIDLTKYQNKLDVAVVAGVGYQFAGGLQISANYQLGMMNVPDFGEFTLGDNTFTLNPDAKNRVLQVSIGYRF